MNLICMNKKARTVVSMLADSQPANLAVITKYAHG